MIDVSASGHYVGDCRELLAQLPDGCVQTCITSPPYWGLRDYGTATWDGGDPACDHLQKSGGTAKTTLGKSDASNARSITAAFVAHAHTCGKCGATRIDRQIGLEATPDEYVSNMVEVFRAVRRALADDGTLWLNLGDSYAGGAITGSARPGNPAKNGGASNRNGLGRVADLKPKDLVGIPWMVAFALRADGWYLRSDVIWHKPNPMPESVTDRPTKSHEYVFLFAKSDRYFYDADAVREPMAHPDLARRGRSKIAPNVGRVGDYPADSGRRDGGRHVSGAGFLSDPDAGRNKRDVWTVPSTPFSGAHFATMPPALVDPCVLAGSRVGDLVLDPFFGSGTTGMVAEKHGRRWVGFDLNPRYEALQKERTAQRSLVLPPRLDP